MSDKLILEYEAEGTTQRMTISNCLWHKIDKCRFNYRSCLYPSESPPEHCHLVGTVVMNGIIKRAT